MSEPVTPAPPTVNRTIVIASKKSMGIALLLSFFFGPLGLLYATVPGGIILIVITLIIGVLSFGIGLILGWLIAMIWAAIAVAGHNKKVDAMATSY